MFKVGDKVKTRQTGGLQFYTGVIIKIKEPAAAFDRYLVKLDVPPARHVTKLSYSEYQLEHNENGLERAAKKCSK